MLGRADSRKTRPVRGGWLPQDTRSSGRVTTTSGDEAPIVPSQGGAVRGFQSADAWTFNQPRPSLTISRTAEGP